MNILDAAVTNNIVLDVVKIKQEKITPPRELNREYEVEKDITDEKKPTEPVKTSNELLTELFKVFNAAPPESLLTDDKYDSDCKRTRKKKKDKYHRDRKHKKKSKRKSKKSDSENGELSDSTPERRIKIKSEHKHKKSSHIDPRNLVDKNPEKRTTERSIKIEAVSGNDKNSGQTTNIEITTSKTHRIQIKSSKDNLVLKSKHHQDKEITSRKRRNNSETDFSISDDEMCCQSKSIAKKNRDYEDFDKFYASYNDNHSRYKESYHEQKSSTRDGSSRNRRDLHGKYRDDEKWERHDRSQYSERQRSYSSRKRSFSHDRSRSRSGERIDKKRLLEIARKNAILMLKNGSIPGTLNLAPEDKEKIIAKMKYTGKTVEELTSYCKKLSNGEDLNELSNISGDDSDHDKEGNNRAFNHPFIVKDRGPIVMNIRNATVIPPKSAEQTKALSMLFPVSSGSAHKKKTEEWIPVSPKRSDSKQKCKAVSGNKKKDIVADPKLDIDIPPVISVGFQVEEANILAVKSSEVFPNFGENLDVSQIISQRLNAMRKLQENPEDSKAIQLLQTAQKDMSAWASSKFVPGQFLGSTGVNVLSAKELASGQGAGPWAKKDQLITAQPLTSGMGMHLLQKMGWRPGEGLGKDKSGSLQPLLLEVKLDKRGLVSNEEAAKPKRVTNVPARMMVGKHPVSLLGELASKKKWGSPMYDVVQETGPQHSKTFVFKVRLNGMEYQPATGCNNKKEAKAMAAKFCLQQLGVLPT